MAVLLVVAFVAGYLRPIFWSFLTWRDLDPDAPWLSACLGVVVWYIVLIGLRAAFRGVTGRR